MNVKFLNPFLDAAHEVVLQETGCPLERGALSLKQEPYWTDDVTVILSLVGQVQGTVFYSMQEITALALIQKMLDEQITEMTGLVQSGIAELANVITGRAGVKLAEAGYEATISTPTYLGGKGTQISCLDIPRLVVPLAGSCGAITIHLAIRENVA